ncbi:hypothetical protein UlMin_038817 [Ulmus minor]
MVKACNSVKDTRFVLDVKWAGLNDFWALKDKFTIQHNTLFMFLSIFMMIDELKSVYLEMLEDMISLNIYTFNTMVDKLKKANSAGLSPDTFTYTSLILGYCRNKDVDSAHKVFETMLKTCFCRNKVSYTNLIHGLCEAGRIDDAFELFSWMGEENLYPTVRTYTVLIFALSGLARMYEITYNSLIHGQCKAGHLDSAYRLLKLMNESGLVPDQWTYSIFIDAPCKRESLKEAHALFDFLKEKGIKPNEVIYTSLIDGMLGDDCLPNSYTYNVLIDGLCREKRVQEASFLVETMLRKGVKPIILTYTVLIKEMLKGGNQPNVFMYTTFIYAYCSIGNLEKVEDFMAMMNKEGVFPDSLTYTLLVNAYGCLGLKHHAFDVLKHMMDASCEPSHYTYAFLIKHLTTEKGMETSSCDIRLDLDSNISCIDIVDVWKTMDFEVALNFFEKMDEHAHKLFEHMREKGIFPSEDIYNSLFNCYCDLQVYEEAMRLVDIMIENGYFPSLESSKLLVCGLFDKESDEKAKSTFRSLLRGGYNHDEVAWKLLIEGLLRKGLVDRCYELLGIMEKMGCQLYPQTYSMWCKQKTRNRGNKAENIETKFGINNTLHFLSLKGYIYTSYKVLANS